MCQYSSGLEIGESINVTFATPVLCGRCDATVVNINDRLPSTYRGHVVKPHRLYDRFDLEQAQNCPNCQHPLKTVDVPCDDGAALLEHAEVSEPESVEVCASG